MICDFHTHTFFSDGLNSPIELIRNACANGYDCIGIADHASLSNIDILIKSIQKDCRLAEKYWDIKAIPGVELTNVPSSSIDELAEYAKSRGARFVVVHGESPVEKVEKGTNKSAVSSSKVDILAHPGFITEEEAEMAARNGIFLEVTYRKGHNRTNGLVAKIATKTGAKMLINSDAHSHEDLFFDDEQYKTALGAGLTRDQVEEIVNSNFSEFIERTSS